VILDRQAQLDDVVAKLQKRERDGFVRLPRKPRLQKGDPVTILAGSFEGMTAWYEGQSGSDRVRVLLDLLGRKVPLDIAESQISTSHMLRQGNR
jgi:transcription antitermination factor NusG